MNRSHLGALLVLGLLLGGCSGQGYDRSRDSTASQPSTNPPANPYSTGGFSDPGPNYPPTGH